jgi:hypothetical protein
MIEWFEQIWVVSAGDSDTYKHGGLDLREFEPIDQLDAKIEALRGVA